MNRVLFLFVLLLAPAALAQDFLQQWRDDAAKGMAQFRDAHRAPIEAAGWRFVTGTMNAEEVPISDLFIRQVKAEGGSVRSAYLLNSLYVAVPESDTPEYHSTKLLVWIDCKEGGYEQRILERYATVDGTGNPVSRVAEKQPPGAIELVGADKRSWENALVTAVCSSRKT